MANGWIKPALIAGIGGALTWKSLSPETKRKVLRTLDQLAFEAAQTTSQQQLPPANQPLSLPSPSTRVPLVTGRYEPPHEHVSTHRQLPGDLLDALRKLKAAEAKEPMAAIAAPDPDSAWRTVITHPSIVLVLGKRGAGKSALGYRLLELFRYQLAPFAVGIPETAAKALPEWIGVVEKLEEAPPKSIVLLDEAHLRYHSRDSARRGDTGISRLLNLSRQREQTVIFISQEARQIDVNIASSANVLIFKEPSMLQFEFERRELRQLAQRAADAFSGLTKAQRKRSAYVHAPDADFQEIIESDLPSYWNSRISKAFASAVAPAPTRKPSRPSRSEKQERAVELRAAGWSLSRIASEIGVSKSTVVNYVKGYPYAA